MVVPAPVGQLIHDHANALLHLIPVGVPILQSRIAMMGLQLSSDILSGHKGALGTLQSI